MMLPETNPPAIVVRAEAPLAELARQIAEAHRECEAAQLRAVEKAAAAGALLLQAKDRVGHGGWLDWLKANVPFTPRTAQNYMRLARETADPGKAKRVSHLPLREALRVLAGGGEGWEAHLETAGWAADLGPARLLSELETAQQQVRARKEEFYRLLGGHLAEADRLVNGERVDPLGALKDAGAAWERLRAAALDFDALGTLLLEHETALWSVKEVCQFYRAVKNVHGDRDEVDRRLGETAEFWSAVTQAAEKRLEELAGGGGAGAPRDTTEGG
jgi:hypothetical protein